MRRNEVFLAVTRLLRERGIDYAIRSGGKHSKIVFEVNGHKLFWLYSNGSRTLDRRTVHNSLAGIRALLRKVETARE